MSRNAAPDWNARRASQKEGLHMCRTESQVIRTLVVSALIALRLSACSINVKKQQNGEDKQVDIQTPVGGIHVSQDANVSDVGLTVYPGARLKQQGSNGGDKSANVDISSFGFRLKVVALEYESDDPPAKLVAYYRDQLQKYGHVLECHTSNFDVKAKHWDHDSHELTCEGSSSDNIELKVGTKENQHIVAVGPEGRGSKLSLVYVRIHGKE